MPHNIEARTEHVPRGARQVTVEVTGDGPLVLCIPGIGDLRSSYRHLTPALVAAGYRVAAMDLRGHGDSDTGFDAYDGASIASDALAAIEHLGEQPATIIGNSMGADAAVQAAALAPERIERLVLVGPFVRDASSAASRALFGVLFAKPWGPAIWRAYFARLFPAGGPADLPEHRAAVDAALRRPGRWSAFRRMATASHAAAEAVLSQVRAKTLVVMGERDPDWKDPAAEASWVAAQLDGDTAMIPEAGHYPHAERPEAVLAALLPFLDQAPARG